MEDKTTQLVLTLNTGSEIEKEELEEWTRHLRLELLDLELEAVDFVTIGKAPQKAKSGDPITWGTLLLTLAASGGVIVTLINFLQTWTMRHEGRSVTIKINGDELEITGVSSEEQKRLIDTWLNRHRGFLISDD